MVACCYGYRAYALPLDSLSAFATVTTGRKKGFRDEVIVPWPMDHSVPGGDYHQHLVRKGTNKRARAKVWLLVLGFLSFINQSMAFVFSKYGLPRTATVLPMRPWR